MIYSINFASGFMSIRYTLYSLGLLLCLNINKANYKEADQSLTGNLD